MSNRVKIMAGALAVVVVGLGVVAGTALAQDAANGDAQAPAEDAASGLCGRFIEGVASHLGVTVEELEAAARATKLDMLDEAVEAGKIDPERAARIGERIEEGSACLHPHPRQNHRGPGQLVRLVAYAAAETLDMTPRELVGELRECQSLAQVAEARDVDRDELKSGILGEVEERLDEAVANERITQEKADRILQELTDRLNEVVDAVRCPAGATGA